MPSTNYFATTAKGLETVVAAELKNLGLKILDTPAGGVHFSGTRADGYRACLWLRSANRVLQPIASFPCHSADSLYDQVYALPWTEYLLPEMTLAVDCRLRSSLLTHSRYVALKTKDAIVDKLRDRTGRRPDVNPGSPDLRLNVHLADNQCTVSLDLAGDSLHRRGYREGRVEAPLRETLAAGLIGLSGWEGTTSFADPMCGSGTLPLEAAFQAIDMAPGLLGRSFGFERWPDFDDRAWREIRNQAREVRRQNADCTILGADRNPRALDQARKNASRAGIDNPITWRQSAFAALTPPDQPGTLLVNPPYGERLGEVEALENLYRAIGDILKQRWTGWTAWVFTGNLELAKKIGLKASRRLVLFNGPIECRLLKYQLY
ncbi:MAG TPA: THUMP domain-containing protein [Desulfuromonadales bacterium]|nr:THUMP domain-containing protein [Desulfuromonadales bacterium]